MKTGSALVTVLAVFLPAVSGARCNADNCARAATGTLGGQQSARLAACSSFQQCTVTPRTVTTTYFSTVTLAPASYTLTTSTAAVTGSATSLAAREIRARDDLPGAVTNCPTAVPAAASSACSGSSRYASACSCAGITEYYTTTTAPSTSITLTVSVPAPSSPAPPARFQLQAYSPGTQWDGSWVDSFLPPPGPLDGKPNFMTSDQSVANTFYLDGAYRLLSQGYISEQDPGTEEGLSWASQEAIDYHGWVTTACFPVPDTTGAFGQYRLQCTAQGNTILQICGGQMILAAHDYSKIYLDCFAAIFRLIPAV